MLNSLLRICLAFYSMFYSTVSFVSMSLTITVTYRDLTETQETSRCHLLQEDLPDFLLNENLFTLNFSSTLYLFYGIYHNLLSTMMF